jgi:hypothetical protein
MVWKLNFILYTLQRLFHPLPRDYSYVLEVLIAKGKKELWVGKEIASYVLTAFESFTSFLGWNPDYWEWLDFIQKQLDIQYLKLAEIIYSFRLLT